MPKLASAPRLGPFDLGDDLNLQVVDRRQGVLDLPILVSDEIEVVPGQFNLDPLVDVHLCDGNRLFLADFTTFFRVYPS